jgi:hypothetical protein
MQVSEDLFGCVVVEVEGLFRVLGGLTGSCGKQGMFQPWSFYVALSALCFFRCPQPRAYHPSEPMARRGPRCALGWDMSGLWP